MGSSSSDQFSGRASVALELSEKNPNVKIVKYEDMVSKKDAIN